MADIASLDDDCDVFTDASPDVGGVDATTVGSGSQCDAAVHMRVSALVINKPSSDSVYLPVDKAQPSSVFE